MRAGGDRDRDNEGRGSRASVRPYIGAERAASVSPYERATSFEPIRARNPTFAVGRGSREAWLQAAAAVRAFRAAYRAALVEWCKGVRDVLFPEGTWWMRAFHAVCSGPQGPAA